MRLVNFKVTALHGYLDIDIPFMKDLTFLIGTNGSGKTSVLRLIYAIMNCDLKELATIKFQQAELKIEDNKKDIIVIGIARDKGVLNITYTEGEIMTHNSFEIMPNHHISKVSASPETDFRRALSIRDVRFKELETSNKILSLQKTIFLDISRFVRELIKKDEWVFNEERIVEEKEIGIDKALDNIQTQFYFRTRRNAAKQQMHADRLKSGILQTCFHFEEANHYAENLGRVISPEFIKELEEKEKTLMRGVELLGDEKVIEECKKYFVEMTNTINNYKNLEDDDSKAQERLDLLMKLIVNSATLDKYDKFIVLSNKYKQQIDNLKQPFTRFEASVNKFFDETNKKVTVDGRGDIAVRIDENTRNGVHELSSGEKQIIAIFADMALNVNERISVILIDEPDLSLHITWQEKLVEALQIVNPDVQYVLATHSPSIISRLEWRDNAVELTNAK